MDADAFSQLIKETSTETRKTLQLWTNISGQKSPPNLLLAQATLSPHRFSLGIFRLSDSPKGRYGVSSIHSDACLTMFYDVFTKKVFLSYGKESVELGPFKNQNEGLDAAEGYCREHNWLPIRRQAS